MKLLHEVLRASLRVLLPASMVLVFTAAPGWAQAAADKAPSKAATASKPAAAPQADAQHKNIQAYIDLMRKDVRQQKAEIMGSVMLLSAGDAAKFWPIYEEYDTALTKLNDQRAKGITQYASDYAQMTDEEADQLIQKAMSFQKQRGELLEKTYGKVKDALGAITAARFMQVEHQLLLLVDLQIASSLPIVGQN